ncbi:MULTISPECIES: tetratricopeptide repeat protein [Butyricimonas]|uniref:tetratricopeptide repeat protein n=1 Tax=Butyricimonas TaxID=574697 RepID=UPI001D085963|nr:MULTISPECIES: tetratricopeptide repeat protein [Butyricimonas]MCB6973557.1 tetratricopeptide repeat protein [Butyricimonas synergistica]MCG4520340.1 tetratricopeptide repeat protein [Butyricimonas sp. DFI.6.44]
MKKIAVLALGMCLFTIGTKAQTLESKFGLDSANTILNASLYTEYFKQKNYEEALAPWRYVFLNAPAFQLNTYVRGEVIMEYMIRKTKKKEYVDTLMMVFDRRNQYMKNNPNNKEGIVLGKKGMAQFKYANGDINMIKDAFHNMMKSYELEKDVPPMQVHMTFQVACALAKENQLTKDDFINLYIDFADFVDKQASSGEKGCDDYLVCKANLEAMFIDSGLADCMTLNDLLVKKYEANKDSLSVLKDIYKLLKKQDCTDLPLYATIAESIYHKEPSAEAAYGLAIMFYRKNDIPKFEQYLKEAIDKTDNETDRADYNLNLAQVYLSTKRDYQQAKKYALAALKSNPNLGQAYLTIGLAYASASNNYEGDEFEKRTVFWAAVDKFVKAKQVDPSVAEKANEFISKYSIYFPSKEDAFFRSITAGANVKVGGWINETTTARFKE